MNDIGKRTHVHMFPILSSQTKYLYCLCVHGLDSFYVLCIFSNSCQWCETCITNSTFIWNHIFCFIHIFPQILPIFYSWHFIYWNIYYCFNIWHANCKILEKFGKEYEESKSDDPPPKELVIHVSHHWQLLEEIYTQDKVKKYWFVEDKK